MILTDKQQQEYEDFLIEEQVADKQLVTQRLEEQFKEDVKFATECSLCYQEVFSDVPVFDNKGNISFICERCSQRIESESWADEGEDI